MNPIINSIEDGNKRANQLDEFQVGDVIDVHVRIQEGEKERVQIFSGTVIKIKNGKGLRGTFTVRRIVASEGVERCFPYHSPVIQAVQVKRPGKVRRARLYYLRDRVGKATKVKERRVYDQAATAKKKRKKKSPKAADKPVEEPVA